MNRGERAAKWLEKQFRIKRAWNSAELVEKAWQDGISNGALYSDEAKALPIMKRKGMTYKGDITWRWIAQDGWPT